jgi:predicted nucleic acid-binding protein
VTVLEVQFGLQILTAGKRRTSLTEAFEEVLARIGQRVLAFDVAAAGQASDLMAARHKKGRPGDLRDTMIAGIALAQHATLATRNTVHYEDASIPLVNPWAV